MTQKKLFNGVFVRWFAVEELRRTTDVLRVAADLDPAR
jgi:hypothetical protein